MSGAPQKPHFTKGEIAQARAIDMVKLVGGSVPLKRIGRRYVGLCPFHKEKTPSFGVETGRSNYKCFGCGAGGDAIEFVRRVHNLDFVEAVKFLLGDSAHPRLRIVARSKKLEPLEALPEVTKARDIWRQATPVASTPVESYMRARGLSTFPAGVRAILNYNWYLDGALPVMVVAVQGPSGHIIGVQLTALTPNGSRKAFGKDSRRTEGILAAGAARFAPAAQTLGLAEGTETAIAAQELTGVPCWASLGAHRMHAILIPETIRELHIFADDDATGRAAAERTAESNRHRRVIVRYPPEGMKDWDELLLAVRCP